MDASPGLSQGPSSWIATVGVLCLFYTGATLFYNLFLHPLAAFPGPLLARSSLAWRLWSTLGGQHHRHMEKLHAEYGDVVRVSPNELSFASTRSYEDIYGFPKGGRQHFIKGDFYEIYGSAYKTGCIGSERDPATHARKKKNLAPAFTTRALSAQEHIVQQYMDVFIRKIGGLSLDSPKGLNLTKWFEMLTFDILGEMAFGESFGCLAEEKHHFWIDLIMEHLYEITLVDNLRRFWLLRVLGKLLLPSIIMPVRSKHSGYSIAKVKRRLESSSERGDFFTNLVDKVKTGDADLEEMTAHASTLIIAGAETTATEMSAATYYVLKNPAVKDKLCQEIRSRYKSYDEIDWTSAQQLPYLRAVINEAMRMHPSGAHGFPRVSPGSTVDGKFVPKGAEVYTSTWVVSHSPQYFRNPHDFDPSRWIDPDSRDTKEASQPFSLGARACIGRNFAYSQMSSCLAKMFFTYDLELVDKTLDWEAASRHYVMWWKAPINVRCHPRAT